MKLILSSAGFSNKKVFDKFIELLEKPISDVKVIFIPTAAIPDGNMKYVNLSLSQLKDIGINNIQILDLETKVTEKDFDGTDVIFVCGGNTYYLLAKIRESGLDKLLPDFNGLYFGISAGSIVVGPNIKVSAPFDENIVGLTDTKGLNLVDFVIIPHAQRKEKYIIDTLRQNVSYETIELTDNQAIFVENEERTVIG